MEPLGASFRDPSGFVYRQEGRLLRQVNRSYADDYAALMGSGLYQELVDRGWLVAHEEVEPGALPEAWRALHHRTLRPQEIDFVSYPYEWCFSQLRQAARLTLRIQQQALAAGLCLKDASAYNVQFQAGRAVFIDTLSFERYREGEPWVGYRQFCQHFLAPLALVSRRDPRLAQLLRVHLDGIPLDLAASLLPARSWLSPGLLMHLRLHARYQRRHERTGEAAVAGAAGPSGRGLSRSALENLLGSLDACVKSLDWAPEGTTWADYYEGDSYSDAAFARKRELVARFVKELAPATVWDLGANTGEMSRLAVDAGARVVAFDIDPACVERCWRAVREAGEERLLPLWLDLANPSPALGWANAERTPIGERGRPDLILALALVHHLAIGNNVPLDRVVDHLAALAPALVIEFVPKSDPKVRALLATREDVFPGYTVEGFEAALTRRFHIRERAPVEGTDRTLYLAEAPPA